MRNILPVYSSCFEVRKNKDVLEEQNWGVFPSFVCPENGKTDVIRKDAVAKSWWTLLAWCVRSECEKLNITGTAEKATNLCRPNYVSKLIPLGWDINKRLNGNKGLSVNGMMFIGTQSGSSWWMKDQALPQYSRSSLVWIHCCCGCVEG